MRPGDYRFVDYPKVGAPLSLLVLIGSAAGLNSLYG